MVETVSHMEACRICANFFLSSEMEFVSLFQPEEHDLVDFIHNELTAWELKIMHNDGLPQHICGNCFNRFCSIQSFRLECEQAQQKFRQALLPQCNDSAEDLVQLQLLPDHMNMMAANEYLPGEVPVEVAEVVVGLEAVQEVEVHSVQQQVHTDFAVYEQNFADLASNALEDNTAAEQLESNGLMNGDGDGDDDDDDDDMLPLLPTEAADSLKLSPASTDTVFAQEANSILDSKTIADEMEDIAAQDLETLLQGSIIPTNKNKVDMNVDSPGSSHSTEEFSDNDIMDTYDTDTDTPQTRLSGNPLACQYCYCPPIGNINYLVFLSSEALSQHFFDVHDPNLPYTCPQCSNIYKAAQERDIHVRQLHEKPVMPGEQCTMCRKKLRSTQEVHEYTCNFIGDWECPHCNEKFPQTALHRFRAHERIHDPTKQMRCGLCGRMFLKRAALEEHVQAHALHPETMVECDICLAAFNTDYEMKRHKYQAHNGALPVYCEHCSKGFVSKAFLTRHIKHFHPEKLTTSHAIDSVTCRNCNTNFGTVIKLRNHLQRQRDRNGKCTDVIVINKERRRVQRQGIFPCSHCSKRFHMKSQLEKHMNTHDERLRPHQCDMCHIRCRTAFELQQHVDVAHLNVKAFECTQCGKRFGYNKDLQHHMLFHADVNVQCTEEGCDYVCKNDKALNDHIRHKHRLIPCEYCGETFTRQRLTIHLRSAHRAEIDLEFRRNEPDATDNMTEAAVNSITDKVRVELVNPEPSITPLALQDQLPNSFIASSSHVEGYFFSSLLDPDNEIIVT